LPYAFRRAGILVTLALLILSAIMTNFSLYILCACARRTGGRSYGDVARAAFGPLAEILTTAILFVLLLGILVAYMVLLKGIWTPMILSLAVSLNIIEGFDEDHFSKESNALLLVLLFCLFPLLLKRDLYALRYTCYVGFCSLVILTFGLATKAYQRNVVVQPGIFAQKVLWYTSDIKEVIFVFPIVMMSFLCCFNVLGVHGSLIEPTRKRMRLVLDRSIGICLVFFSIVGLCGYLDTYDDTKDNVFLDYTISNRIIVFGRIGYAFTILFGIPLVILPCRESFLSIPKQIAAWRYEAAQRQQFPHPAANSNLVNGVNFSQEMPPSESQANKPVYGSTDYGTSTSSTIETGNSEISVADATFWEYLVHVLSTAALVIVGYVAAVVVPGVAMVLSICGSSMAMLISFIIPAACYIKIRWHKPVNPRSIGAWILLVFSSVAAIVCTTQTLSEILGA
jgi:amino acid permease